MLRIYDLITYEQKEEDPVAIEYRSSKHNQTTEKAEFEDRRKINGQIAGRKR